MTVLALRGASLPPLEYADFELGAGLHAVVGSPDSGLDLLIELVSGTRAPRWGKVLIDGSEPARCPALRRRIGSLFAQEELPSGRRVGQALEIWSRARGGPGPREALEQVGIGFWETRPVALLTPAERRSVALAAALAVPRPLVLALYEPFSDLPGVSGSRTLELLRAAAAEGACVLGATASLRDAVRLGGSVWLLERGRVVARGPSPSGLLPGSEPEWLVRCDRPRELARRLAELPEVTELAFDLLRADDQLVVRARPCERTGLLVLQVARQSGVRVKRLCFRLPTLDAVLAASAGAARAAYERAYHAVRTGFSPPPAGQA